MSEQDKSEGGRVSMNIEEAKEYVRHYRDPLLDPSKGLEIAIAAEVLLAALAAKDARIAELESRAKRKVLAIPDFLRNQDNLKAEQAQKYGHALLKASNVK